MPSASEKAVSITASRHRPLTRGSFSLGLNLIFSLQSSSSLPAGPLTGSPAFLFPHCRIRAETRPSGSVHQANLVGRVGKASYVSVRVSTISHLGNVEARSFTVAFLPGEYL